MSAYPALLGNAMELLEERTGIPTVAIVPMRRHALPEEDAFRYRGEPTPGRINVALLLFPYASNLDEFDPLVHAPGVTVTPIVTGASLAGYDAIILSGSTNTQPACATCGRRAWPTRSCEPPGPGRRS